MKIIRYIPVLFCIASVFLLTAGCSSSSDEKEEPAPEITQDVEISVNYSGKWLINGLTGINDELNSYISDFLPDGIGRHFIRIYKAEDVASSAVYSADFVLEKEIEGSPYDFSLSASLPAGDYVLKVWSDFRESADAEPYYDASKFPHVMLAHHSLISSYQDCFSGSKAFTVEEKPISISVRMQRPAGRYILVCEDFTDLIENPGITIDDVNVVAAYTGFYPDTYSVITDRLTDSLTGEYVLQKPEILSDGAAIVAADFMLINSGGSSAALQLTLVNSRGETLASSESLSIPINRNEVTIIRGKFLKATSEDNGGFEMDTGFDGDITIKPEKP